MLAERAYRILSKISLAEGISITRASRNLCTRSQASIYIKNLEKEGIVFCIKDGRDKKLYLTDKGKETLKEWRN